MDVTSPLNLEREAGMGENTERQPVEPAKCGAWAAAPAEPRPEGTQGVRAKPGGGPASASFLHRPAACSLASPPAAHAQALVPHLQPHHIRVILLPPEKQHTPKQPTKGSSR